jgi:hypothetical protein
MARQPAIQCRPRPCGHRSPWPPSRTRAYEQLGRRTTPTSAGTLLNGVRLQEARALSRSTRRAGPRNVIAVVGPLDPGDDRQAEFLSGGPAVAVEHVLLQQGEEGLDRGIVTAPAGPIKRTMPLFLILRTKAFDRTPASQPSGSVRASRRTQTKTAAATQPHDPVLPGDDSLLAQFIGDEPATEPHGRPGCRERH